MTLIRMRSGIAVNIMIRKAARFICGLGIMIRVRVGLSQEILLQVAIMIR